MTIIVRNWTDRLCLSCSFTDQQNTSGFPWSRSTIALFCKLGVVCWTSDDRLLVLTDLTVPVRILVWRGGLCAAGSWFCRRTSLWFEELVSLWCLRSGFILAGRINTFIFDMFQFFMDPDSCLHLIFDQIMFKHVTDVNDPVCDGTKCLGPDLLWFVMIHSS